MVWTFIIITEPASKINICPSAHLFADCWAIANLQRVFSSTFTGVLVVVINQLEWPNAPPRLTNSNTLLSTHPLANKSSYYYAHNCLVLIR